MGQHRSRHDQTSHSDLFRAFPETPDVYRTQFPPSLGVYKSSAEKLAYVHRLPTEIQPFVRKYFQDHADELAILQTSESAAEYYRHLRTAWDQHIAVNRVIDCFLMYEIGNVFGDWSAIEWRMARRLLRAGMDSDHKKTMYSGGLKTKLDLETARLVAKYGHTNPNFKIALLTPSFITFYEAYDLQHKKYVRSILQKKPDESLKTQLIERYHGGDEGLFALRIAELAKRADLSELDRQICSLEKMFRERGVAKGYLVMERPDISDFERLLQFDNVTEYEYTYSLRGLPDLFLREEVLRRLIAAELFPPNISVFALSFDDFSAAIDSLLLKLDRHFTVRLRPYHQHFDTCGVACIMSLLNRKGIPLDESTELRLWELVGKPYNFPGGLAWILLKRGFRVTYVQDWPELLRQDNPEFTSMDRALAGAASTYLELHQKAVDAGLHFEIADWGFQRVEHEIARGNVCLLYLYVSETMTHVVIARGIKRDRIEIIDPLGAVKYLSRKQLDDRIRHPMGRRLLIVKKLPQDFFDTLTDALLSLGY